jgi:hypothetical protein
MEAPHVGEQCAVGACTSTFRTIAPGLSGFRVVPGD